MPRRLAAAALAAAALAAPLAAQPFTPRGEAGGWRVFFNDATGGCFMERVQGDLVVQMGTQGGADFGFIAAYTKGEVGIAQGEEMTVIIEIDGDGFGGVARGVRRDRADGVPIEGAVTISRSPAFLEALAEGRRMRVVSDTGALVEIDLAGTRAGIAAVRACQADLGEAG
jgi:hypothetical protein